MDKADILREIKRTAEANGGIPLGKDRLHSETGIKQSDWQKYWARLSDAHQELGYTPNQLQQPFDKTELLAKYAKYAQQLGQLPAEAHLRLQAHRDPEFPCASTFSNRLGTKPELVAQLLDHCRSRGGYDDVVRMCEEYAPPVRAVGDKTGPAPGKIYDGYVYLIRSGRFYKIGKTNAAGRREYELDIQLPEKVRTIHLIRTDDPTGIEAYWHKRFEAKRKKGEWFELHAADVAAFKRRRFM